MRKNELNIQNKLDETKYFHEQMIKNLNTPREFSYNLSALLACGRTIQTYIFKIVKYDVTGKWWYDNLFATKSKLSFFREQRNIVIHENPVKIKTNISIEWNENICLLLSQRSQLLKVDASGNVIENTDINLKDDNQICNDGQFQDSTEKFNNAIIEYEYCFVDWPGSENVMQLVKEFIVELEEMISEGTTKGYF